MNRLVVEVTTIRGGSVSGRPTVTASIGGAPAFTLAQSSPREFTCPLSATGDFDMTVTAEAAPDFWADSGSCSASIPNVGRAAVTLSGGGGGAITFAGFEGSPGFLTLRLRISVSKLRDVSQEIQSAFGSPKPAMTWPDEMMLNPSGTGTAVLRGSILPTAVDSSRFIVGKWRSNGIRVGIYLPKAGLSTPGCINIFAKPPKHGGWDAPGIFGFYMFWGEPGDVVPKHLVAQTEASGKPYAIAMPAPEDGTALTYGNSQAGVLELAEEIDVLIRRKILRQQGALASLQKLALSCFSRGTMAWSSVMGGGANGGFLDRMRGLWLLDGHLDSGYAEFANVAHAWQRGSPDRTIRVYSSEGNFSEMMTGTGSRTPGPAGSWQWRSAATVPGGFAATNYTFMPSSLWAMWNPAAEKGIGAHQLIPNTCMSHALKTSGP